MAGETGTVHASAVVMGGRGLLVTGPSGSGKSALCLSLMGRGAVLVADDRVRLWRDGDRLMADAPASLVGLIEARVVGILRADAAGPSPIDLIVDLGLVEDQRLPPWRTREVLGLQRPLVFGPLTPHLDAALRQYMLAGRAG